MASTVSEWVATLCPGKESDPRFADFEQLAKYYVGEDAFGDKWEYAQALVICHFFTLEAQGGGNDTTPGSGVVGGIKSEKEGDLQRTYGGMSTNLSENKQFWGSTSHGMALLALWDACILMPRTRWV